MNLSSKLMLGFGGLWLLFLVATIISMAVLEQHGRTLDTALHSNYDSVVYCEKIKRSNDELNLECMKVIWDHTEFAPAAINSAVEHFKTGEAGQKQNITLPGEAEMTKRLFSLCIEYQTAVRKFATLPLDQRSIFFQTDLLPRHSEAQSAARSVIDLNLNHMRQISSEVEQNLGHTRHVQLACVIAGGALAIASVLVLRRTILKPLRTLTESAHQVQRGDFDLKIPVNRHDEIGTLSESFNTMAERLRHYRKLDENRIARLQSTLQHALDSLPDAVAIFSADGKVEISNQQAVKHFGLVPGMSIKEIALPLLHDLFTAPLQSGQPVYPSGYQSAIQLFEENEERFLLPRAMPIFDNQKHALGVVVALIDITRLRQADELKSGLVATASHELKTPLAAARFAVHVLANQEMGALSAAQTRLVETARDGVDRLHRIIENLLDLSRIEAGKRELPLASTSPHIVVEEAVRPLQPDFERRGIQLDVHVDSILPSIKMNVVAMTQALSNLVINALKFTPPRGKVNVSAGISGQSIHFLVEDSGPGIPPEHLPRIFDRFYRVPVPQGPTGAGLGLAIAKEIVDAHGGKIAVSTSSLGGAAFTIELPLS